MKKIINSINNPKSDTIYPLCLIATMLCAVQVITHVARLVILVYQLFTIKPADTISYLDLLSGEPVTPPGVFQILFQLLLAAVPVCLCVLSFRGMSRPVQKGSLIITGVCMIVTSLLMVLMTLWAYLVMGSSAVVLAEIAGFALTAAAVLIMTGKGSNVVVLALIVVSAVAATVKSGMPVEPLYVLSVGLASFAVLMASQDPKMA